MANELVGAAAFLDSTLANDPELAAIVGTRIFADFAPEGTAYPLIVFSHAGGDDVRALGTYRAMTKPLYFVRVIGEGGGYLDIQAAASRVDALLTVRAVVPVTIGGESFDVLGSVRERPFQRADKDNGKRYPTLGGWYRLNIESQ